MRRALALMIGALLLLPVSSFSDSITELVVFGDSLSDTGNIYTATFGLYPAPPSYTAGMFTDGPDSTPSTTGPLGVWDEQLARMMGVPSPEPFLAGGGGTNYAFGGALTGDDPSCIPCSLIPDVGDQVDAYLATHPGRLPSSSLYSLWAGSNDLLQGVSPQTAVANLTGDIGRLYKHGARNFIWPDLPPLGDTPSGLASGESTTLNLLSEQYKADWLTAIGLLHATDPGIDIVGVNAFGLFESILADPSAYGFTNVTTPAQGLNVNPDTYLFWDDLHPTTEGHYWVANLAYHDLNTPELPTATLLGTALLVGACVVQRRRGVIC